MALLLLALLLVTPTVDPLPGRRMSGSQSAPARRRISLHFSGLGGFAVVSAPARLPAAMPQPCEASWRRSAGARQRGKISRPRAAPYRLQQRRILPLVSVVIVMMIVGVAMIIVVPMEEVVWGTRLPIADVGPEEAADDGADRTADRAADDGTAESPGGGAEGIGESGR